MASGAWMAQWFDTAQQASKGGVIRRARQDVDKYASLQEVVTEALNRGWHVIETGDQVVVLCHEGDMKVHC